jgi:uncharacterized protein (TIGR02147 family)
VLYEHTDYRLYLKEVLAERMRSVPRYSMRKLAREFGISHSTLSGVLAGRSGFSRATALRVTEVLALKPREAEYFRLLVDESGEQDPALRAHLSHKREELCRGHVLKTRVLGMDQFRAVSDWYPFAILGLACLPNFQIDPTSVSRRLKIPKIEAEVAIGRLLKLGLLVKGQDGSISRTPENIVAKSERGSGVINRHYQTMLGRTAQAIETQGPEERISGFEVVPIDRRLLPEARELIENCFSAIGGLSTKSTARTDVYYLSIHCFNLTPNERGAR